MTRVASRQVGLPLPILLKPRCSLFRAQGSIPSREQIRTIVRIFGESAVRAREAGFDGVQIHAGHGFILSQFLSALKNTRRDDYGGTPENCARLLIEIYDESRASTGIDLGIFVKINCSDFEKDDGVFEACRYACSRLGARGIDAVEITGGAGSVPGLKGTSFEESVFRSYAAKVAEETSIPVILVG